MRSMHPPVQWCKMQLKDKDQCDFIWYLNTDSKEAPGIRQWLNIGDKYSEYKAFNRRVLKPSFDEINESTSDIQISFKPLRNGRRAPIYALDMHIESKHKANIIEQKKNKKKKATALLNISCIKVNFIFSFYSWVKIICSAKSVTFK